MYKLVILSIFFVAANAGYLGAPVAYHGAPIGAYHSAPYVTGPVATSYQNTFKISASPVAYTAPYVKSAPVLGSPLAYSAPLIKSAHLIDGPLGYTSPFVKSVFGAPALAYSSPYVKAPFAYAGGAPIVDAPLLSHY